MTDGTFELVITGGNAAMRSAEDVMAALMTYCDLWDLNEEEI